MRLDCSPGSHARALPPTALPLLVLAPLAAWIAYMRPLLSLMSEGEPAGTPGFGAEALVGVALAGTVVLVALEALFWRALWAARGACLPYAPMLLALWLLYAIEWSASAWLARLPASGPAALWAAPWLGYRALQQGADAGAWTIAFANAGLLTFARLALSAWAQARLARRRWREAAAYVAVVWLASHVALAWTIELVRGRALGPR